jgi:hypothetical protein
VLRLALALILSVPATARAGCADDPVQILEAAEADHATGEALRTLLGEPERPGWQLRLEGGRSEARHPRTGERYARTLPAESSPYERALAALELLGAARAACTDRSAVVTPPVPAPSTPAPSPPPLSLTFAAGARFDGEMGGPWLVRPTLAVELGFARDRMSPYPLIGLEAAAFGLYQRSAREQDLVIRYERHDAVLRVGVGIPVEGLTLFFAALGGVTVRDVTGLDEGAAAGHRLDVGAILGADAQLRLALFGPLGLRVGAALVVAPEVATYRAAERPVVTEDPLRFGGTVGLDLELR